MKKTARYLVFIAYMIIGVVLLGLGFADVLDEFWAGMGSALLMVGAVRAIRYYRLNKNEVYRERMEIEERDERNHFIRNKAWAWAGYMYVIIAAVSCIVLRIVGEELLSIVVSMTVCLMLLLFWGSYLILKRKY